MDTKIQIPEPAFSRFIFADTRMAFLWLVIRLYVGWEWLHAGWGKFNSPLWIGDQAGTAIHGFFKGAIAKAAGDHPAVQGWYATLLQYADAHAVIFSYIITFGELAVGVALILGIFTGIAAFFGGFMNMNFLLAGTTSINPILGFLQLLLILAWRVAGWWGLDRYVLPLLGTPWQKGSLLTKKV
mgnify:CR=1 FL=1